MGHLLIYGDLEHNGLPEYLMNEIPGTIHFQIMQVNPTYSIMSHMTTLVDDDEALTIVTDKVVEWMGINRESDVQYEIVYTSWGGRVLSDGRRFPLDEIERKDSAWVYDELEASGNFICCGEA